jgi:hypothetical protein
VPHAYSERFLAYRLARLLPSPVNPVEDRPDDHEDDRQDKQDAASGLIDFIEPEPETEERGGDGRDQERVDQVAPRLGATTRRSGGRLPFQPQPLLPARTPRAGTGSTRSRGG